MTAGRFGGPVQSLTRGLATAQPGDRIVMSNTGEPYRESVTLFGGRNSGQRSQPFVIEGNGATLDGSLPVPPKAWEHFAGDVFRFRPDGTNQRGLAVMRVGPQGGQVIAPAPRAFGGSGA